MNLILKYSTRVLHPIKKYSTGKASIIDTVLTRYLNDCGIKLVDLQSFLADAGPSPHFLTIRY